MPLNPSDVLREAEIVWNTRGPDSGGVAGFAFYRGRIHEFDIEFGGSDVDDGQTPAEFAASGRGPRHAEIVAWLRDHGHLA